ncbi:hypothetical protein FNYG_12295 [Fusarium nygamai]|uniref:Uncharacterized protein n=1 Tax=Gibberella nygamai TaxID=42673 RepID=A0A2K0VW42_GIBNY|nr:hypothetical protein FNYG_12295 [Fusarium nygamai]
MTQGIQATSICKPPITSASLPLFKAHRFLYKLFNFKHIKTMPNKRSNLESGNVGKAKRDVSSESMSFQQEGD